MNEESAYYRRHLPHYHPEGATYHVVFRLAGSLPMSAVGELRKVQVRFERELRKIKDANEVKKGHGDYRQKYFEYFDALMDGCLVGPRWLKQPEVARIVEDALHRGDGKEYELLAYCIMPNHVHLVASVGRLSSRPNDTGLFLAAREL